MRDSLEVEGSRDQHPQAVVREPLLQRIARAAAGCGTRPPHLTAGLQHVKQVGQSSHDLLPHA